MAYGFSIKKFFLTSRILKIKLSNFLPLRPLRFNFAPFAVKKLQS